MLESNLKPGRPVQILDPLISEKIAAGEVVERPSSVVKELAENSLDAGATEVQIVLEDGGKSSIEITDNGSGMSAEDLRLCTERHATSKLSTLADLESIYTLGFRGEALPSVAAVSELTIITRNAESDSAYEWNKQMRTSAGTPSVQRAAFGHFLGSNHGTQVRVRSLFAEVPARLKFLKSQAAEVSQVREWVERLALTHPATGFKLVSGDRTILDLRPTTETDRVLAVLSDDASIPVVSASAAEPGAAIRVHWLQGVSLSHGRRMVQVVNGRALKDRMLATAIQSAFKQALLPGQYPAVALFADIDPSLMDVNVHPTKTEVRFLNGSQIFSLIHHALERLVAERGMTPFAPRTFTEQPQTGSLFEPRSVTESAADDSAGNSPNDSIAHSNTQGDERPTQWTASERSPVAPSTSMSAAHEFANAQFVGVIFQTYVLWDHGTELVMVDQHAAHERIRYEALKRSTLGLEQGAPQQLLIPEQVALGELADDPDRLGRAIAAMTALGFDAELFGQKSLIVRAVPSAWGTEALHSRLVSLVQNLGEVTEVPSDSTSHSLLDSRLFERLASQACRSSIRAGDRIEPAQAKALLAQLLECEHPWNCPHGRPTIVRVPRARLEEWFQRRV